MLRGLLAFLLLSFLSFSICIGQETTLLSWNIQNFGQSKDDSEIRQIAELIRDFDIVAIQEVVAKVGGAPAVARLADVLNRMSERWDYRISDPTTGDSPYKRERYAFLWKPHKLKLIGRPFLDQTYEATILREPYIGRFLIGDKQLIILNYHSRTYDQHPEEEITLFPSMIAQYSSTPVIIAGDFNMNEENPAFDGLEQIGYQPSIRNQFTTLRRKCSSSKNKHPYLANAIDNIYIPTETIQITGKGVLDFVRQCERLQEARNLSDHLGVGIRFNIVQ